MTPENLEGEDLLHCWEPSSELAFIFRFNWTSIQALKLAVAVFLAARLGKIAQQAYHFTTQHCSFEIKRHLAANPASPADLLDFLTQASSLEILILVAENPSTGERTLEKLSQHISPAVRMAVAENANTPVLCLALLADDSHVDVRFRLAENPHLPADLYHRLIFDENPYVCDRASRTLKRVLSDQVLSSAKAFAPDGGSLSSELAARFTREVIGELGAHCKRRKV